MQDHLPFKPSSSAPIDPEFGPTGGSLYERNERPRRDNWCTVSYLILMAFTVFGGIATFAKSDKDFALYTDDFYYNSTTCDVHQFNDMRSQQAMNSSVADDWSTDSFTASFKTSIAIWLPVTAAVGVMSSVVYILLFMKFPLAMVYTSVFVSLAVPFALAILSFIGGAIGGGVILIVMTAIMAGMYWWIRRDFPKAARLLSVAGKGLAENPSLVVASIGIKLAGLCILVYQFAAFVCGIYVGKAGLNPDASLGDTLRRDMNDTMCLGVSGGKVPCCSWQTRPWAGAYCFFNLICILWTIQVILQVKLFTIADTISQWYFAPTAGSQAGAPQPSVRLALKHCLTSSFGSVVFGAGILMLINIIRQTLQQSARNARGGWAVVCCITRCIAEPILKLLEIFTRFSTIAAAISGRGFIDAARSTYDMLKRNFLRTYNLWWIPEWVLGMSAFLMTLSWGGIVFFATYMQWRHQDNRVGLAFAAAAVAMVLMGYILTFIAGVLLDIVNTCYICFAFDRDSKVETRPEIHTIYKEVPTIGPVIEQPDGNLAYGQPMQAPTQPQVQHGHSMPSPYYGQYSAVQGQPLYGAQVPAAQGQPAAWQHGVQLAAQPWNGPR